ncbi:hypothetical protein ACTJNK_29135 [Achromobacter anxifer]
MGYSFTIGNAVPSSSKEDFPDLIARWEVGCVELPDAPVFPGDDMTGNSNSRHPSYSAWSDFCKSVGLYDFFYDSCGHLRAGHPGCIGIEKADVDLVAAALERYRSKSTLPPGFEQGWAYEGPQNYDYHLARLIWLEWWMRWAVSNCETPAIQNT